MSMKNFLIACLFSSIINTISPTMTNVINEETNNAINISILNRFKDQLHCFNDSTLEMYNL